MEGLIFGLLRYLLKCFCFVVFFFSFCRLLLHYLANCRIEVYSCVFQSFLGHNGEICHFPS